jgi:hypothetical protein
MPRLLHLFGAGQHQLGQALGFRRDRVQVVQRHGLGRVFQQVEDVVLARDQLVDVVAVDRRDEGLVQQVDRLVGDLVRLLLDAFDRVHAIFQVIEIGHQAHHLFCAFDAQLGVLVKQVKEFALGGHQTSKHMFSVH